MIEKQVHTPRDIETENRAEMGYPHGNLVFFKVRIKGLGKFLGALI
jgi:hypothetical protein